MFKAVGCGLSVEKKLTKKGGAKMKTEFSKMQVEWQSEYSYNDHRP
jgi:hypothetical protein